MKLSDELSEPQLDELKNNLLYEANCYGLDMFDHFFEKKEGNQTTYNASGDHDQIIDCYFERDHDHPEFLKVFLKGLDKRKIGKYSNLFEKEFLSELDRLVLTYYNDRAVDMIKDYPEYLIYYDSDLLDLVFTIIKWTELYKSKLNERVDSLLQFELTDSNRESVERMISDIAEIAGLPDDRITYLRQGEFVEKLERFERYH